MIENLSLHTCFDRKIEEICLNLMVFDLIFLQIDETNLLFSLMVHQICFHHGIILSYERAPWGRVLRLGWWVCWLVGWLVSWLICSFLQESYGSTSRLGPLMVSTFYLSTWNASRSGRNKELSSIKLHRPIFIWRFHTNDWSRPGKNKNRNGPARAETTKDKHAENYQTWPRLGNEPQKTLKRPKLKQHKSLKHTHTDLELKQYQYQ